MLEPIVVGICLFSVVFAAICVRGFLGDFKSHKQE
jgi:hypothetical protein